MRCPQARVAGRCVRAVMKASRHGLIPLVLVLACCANREQLRADRVERTEEVHQDAAEVAPVRDASAEAMAVEELPDARAQFPHAEPSADASSKAASVLLPEQTLIPHASWSCGMPEGIPSLVDAPLVFAAEATLGAVYDVGQTQYGRRQVATGLAGKAEGPRIHASLWGGGLDYALELSNGALEIDQYNILTTDDGVNIFVRSCGVAPSAHGEVRMVFDFEAPSDGKYAFLNEGTYLGQRELKSEAKRLVLRVFDVTGRQSGADAITIEKPADARAYPWTCVQLSGTKGDAAFTVRTELADGTLFVGASKRGIRNAIPITGGTLSGALQGAVLRAGADFQLLAPDFNFELDARYLLKTPDGTIILVRNCGTLGALVPTYETRVDGPHAALNENQWLSDDPSLGAGYVDIVVHPKQ